MSVVLPYKELPIREITPITPPLRRMINTTEIPRFKLDDRDVFNAFTLLHEPRVWSNNADSYFIASDNKLFKIPGNSYLPKRVDNYTYIPNYITCTVDKIQGTWYDFGSSCFKSVWYDEATKCYLREFQGEWYEIPYYDYFICHDKTAVRFPGGELQCVSISTGEYVDNYSTEVTAMCMLYMQGEYHYYKLTAGPVIVSCPFPEK
jgi:hypothetical protein